MMKGNFIQDFPFINFPDFLLGVGKQGFQLLASRVIGGILQFRLILFIQTGNNFFFFLFMDFDDDIAGKINYLLQIGD